VAVSVIRQFYEEERECKTEESVCKIIVDGLIPLKSRLTDAIFTIVREASHVVGR
jgi:hypothetical protein